VQENITNELSPLTVDHIHNQDQMVSNTWDIAMQTAGFNLLGGKGTFDGLGVVFCDSKTPSANVKEDGVVSSIVGTGAEAFSLKTNVPTEKAQKYNFRTGQDVTVNVRVQPTSAKVEIVGSGVPATELTGTFKSGGYVGLTVFGGTKGVVDVKERSDFINIKSMQVSNHDKSAQGEAKREAVASPAPTAVGGAAAEMQEKLRTSSSHKDHRAESDAIKELTNMVFKLVVETHPLQNEMSNAVGALAKRIEAMENTFAKFKQELDRKTGHSFSTDFAAISTELSSLSNVAATETAERQKQLETLHVDIKDVHTKVKDTKSIDNHLTELTEANQRTIEKLSTGQSNMFGVSVCAIVFVLIAGLSLYNKFRCWEKKHVL
jgi:hypothetical protein